MYVYVHYYSVQMFGFLNFYLPQHSHLLRIVKTTTWPLSAVKPHPQICSPPAWVRMKCFLWKEENWIRRVRRVNSQPIPQLHCHSCKRFGFSVDARDYLLFFNLIWKLLSSTPLRWQLQMQKVLIGSKDLVFVRKYHWEFIKIFFFAFVIVCCRFEVLFRSRNPKCN